MKVRIDISKKESEGRIELLLSSKVRVGSGVVSMYANSGVFINKAHLVPDYKEITNEEGDVIKTVFLGYHINEYKNKRIKSEDIIEAVNKSQELNNLLDHINVMWESADKTSLNKGWLADIVDRYRFPEKYAPKVENKNMYSLFVEYLDNSDFSEGFKRGNMVVIRAVCRWEQYRRATDTKDFHIDIDTLTNEDIDDFRNYLKAEKQLKMEYPKVFAKIVKSYPECIATDKTSIGDRSGNYVDVFLKKFRAFFSWLRKEKKVTTNTPFEGFKFDGEQYGTPFFLSLSERDMLYHSQMTTAHLEKQKDIFVFQCCVGCRVSDLMTLTSANITSDGVLVYSPIKTYKDGKEQTIARVPLSKTAKELISKYEGIDRKGRLFPFTNSIQYNVDIKIVLKEAGITRLVPIRETMTGKTELRPINEVASSHMARRTFVANLYRETPDPNIISVMSGHVQGSRSFERYRSITDDITRALIDKQEDKL